MHGRVVTTSRTSTKPACADDRHVWASFPRHTTTHRSDHGSANCPTNRTCRSTSGSERLKIILYNRKVKWHSAFGRMEEACFSPSRRRQTSTKSVAKKRE